VGIVLVDKYGNEKQDNSKFNKGKDILGTIEIETVDMLTLIGQGGKVSNPPIGDKGLANKTADVADATKETLSGGDDKPYSTLLKI
jgi:hypothetical protein